MVLWSVLTTIPRGSVVTLNNASDYWVQTIRLMD